MTPRQHERDLRPMTAWNTDGKFHGAKFIPGSQPAFENTYGIRKRSVRLDWDFTAPAIDLLRLYGWKEKSIARLFKVSIWALHDNHPKP